MEQYLDQRIINTKQNLYSALFDLLKSSTSIKVLDICKKANITPMTFYHHYGDKTELIKEAIVNQLYLRFPIPLKLKPHNLKQFIYYLMKFFIEFTSNNKELIKGSSLYIDSKSYKNSYLDLFKQTLGSYINNELKLLFSNLQPITINIWSEALLNAFVHLFFNRCRQNKVINFDVMKTSFNLFINQYSILN